MDSLPDRVVKERDRLRLSGLGAVCYYQAMDRRSFEHLCELARLELGPDELVEFERKFKRLLGFVEQVQNYTPANSGPPLTLSERVDPRRDAPRDFPWPAGRAHDYRVPAIIDFEGDS
jgi:Asp-tRNA(Asn)/Glu-tRNA(Gln) amidotransferase C subunit